MGMAIGALWIIAGTIVQATCHNLGGFMAGRFLLGFGVATSATAGPAYVSEMAHPAYRGAMTGLYNVLWFGGGIPGTFIPWRTSTIDGTQSWRIPVWLQMVFSGLVLLLCFTIPEVYICPFLYPGSVKLERRVTNHSNAIEPPLAYLLRQTRGCDPRARRISRRG